MFGLFSRKPSADSLSRAFYEQYHEGNYSEAVPIGREWLRLLESKYGRNHPKTAHAKKGLADALSHTGQHEEAIILGNEAFEGLMHEDNIPITEQGFYNVIGEDRRELADIYRRAGKYNEALEMLNIAYNELCRVNPVEGANYIRAKDALISIALVKSSMGNMDEALAELKNIMDSCGKDDTYRVHVMEAEAMVYEEHVMKDQAYRTQQGVIRLLTEYRLGEQALRKARKRLEIIDRG